MLVEAHIIFVFVVTFVIIFIVVWTIVMLIGKGLNAAQKFLTYINPFIAICLGGIVSFGFVFKYYPTLTKKLVLPIEIGLIANKYSSQNGLNNPYTDIRKGKDQLSIEMGIKTNSINDNTLIQISGYPLGKYRISDVPNGLQLIQNAKLVCQKLNEKYPDLSYNVHIDILGQADAIPSKFRIYDGDLGIISSMSYYSENEKREKKRTLIPRVTRLSNEDFALLRAVNIMQLIEDEELIKRGKINIFTNTSNKIGKKHRLIGISITIDNYDTFFDEEYNQIEELVD